MSRRHGWLLVVLSLWACAPSVARADPYFRTYSDAVVHWSEDRIEVGVDPRLSARFGPDFAAVLAASADAWAVSPEVPVFDIVDVARDGPSEPTPRVWVGIGDHIAFTHELAVTLTTTDARSGEVLFAKVWLNPKTPWAMLSEAGDLAGGARYDLQGVLTHEFGHVLGLNEDEERERATMHPQFHRGEVHQRSLEVSDEEAVSSLYRQRTRGPTSGCAVTVKPAAGTTYASIFVAFFALGLARFRGLLWRRARPR